MDINGNGGEEDGLKKQTEVYNPLWCSVLSQKILFLEAKMDRFIWHIPAYGLFSKASWCCFVFVKTELTAVYYLANPKLQKILR